MPQERLSMRTIKEILRLRWEAGLSYQAIAVSCRKGQTTVRDYLLRAQLRSGLVAVPRPLRAVHLGQ